MANGLVLSIVHNAAFWVLLALLRYAQRALEKQNPRRQPILLYGAWVLWLIINGAAYSVVGTGRLPANAWVLLVLLPTSIVLFWVSWSVVSPFWSIGLRSADRRIEKGIDYRRSLSLVKNELSFLGTGASKLTELREFEAALRRCHSEKPIRFLLMKPSDENLTKAAERARTEREAYKKRVLESLWKIATIRNEHGIPNIEVRFYPESQLGWGISSVFRLMFINGSLCLASYNAFGMSDREQPGSELPQLHVVNLGAEQTATESFYYAMERFYQLLWEQAEPWNFEDFLHD